MKRLFICSFILMIFSVSAHSQSKLKVAPYLSFERFIVDESSNKDKPYLSLNAKEGRSNTYGIQVSTHDKWGGILEYSTVDILVSSKMGEAFDELVEDRINNDYIDDIGSGIIKYLSFGRVWGDMRYRTPKVGLYYKLMKNRSSLNSTIKVGMLLNEGTNTDIMPAEQVPEGGIAPQNANNVSFHNIEVFENNFAHYEYIEHGRGRMIELDFTYNYAFLKNQRLNAFVGVGIARGMYEQTYKEAAIYGGQPSKNQYVEDTYKNRFTAYKMSFGIRYQIL